MNRQLYVMPCFLKPGKQTFIVQSQMFHEDIDEAHNQSSNYGTPDHRFGHQESTVTEMRTEDADLTPQYFFHQAVAPHRREKVPLCKYSLIFYLYFCTIVSKALRRKHNENEAFNKDLTVFKDWK